MASVCRSGSLDSDEDDLAFMKAQGELEEQRMEREQSDPKTSPAIQLGSIPSKFRIQTGRMELDAPNYVDQNDNQGSTSPYKPAYRSFHMNLTKPILNFQDPSPEVIGERRINREDNFKLQNTEDFK